MDGKVVMPGSGNVKTKEMPFHTCVFTARCPNIFSTIFYPGEGVKGGDVGKKEKGAKVRHGLGL